MREKSRTWVGTESANPHARLWSKARFKLGSQNRGVRSEGNR